MNPFLADLYNTASNIGVDKTASAASEKLAQASIVDDYLRRQGHKVEDLTADEVLKVAAEIFGPDSEIVKSAGLPPQFMKKDDKGKGEIPDEKKDEEKKEKESKEKMAEADFLGRVMAHAHVDELRKIEEKAKTASTQPAAGATAVLDRIKSAQAADGSVEKLAQERASAILAANGITQTQPTDAEKLATQVNARAIEILKEKGYEVS